MNQEEKSFVLNDLVGRFDPKTLFPWLPGAGNPELKAALFGLTGDEYRDALKKFDLQARQAAGELLKDKDVMADLEKLPFRRSDTVVVFGDGTAADLQGWFSIVKHMVELTMDGAALKWVNAGAESQTSLDLVRRVERDVLFHKPDWVFISAGTFDAQYVPFHGSRSIISLADTYENFSALESLFADRLRNPPVWIAPVPVFETFSEQATLYEFNFDNVVLDSIRELIAGKPGYVVDPMGLRFGDPAEAWNYASDGINYSMAGHSITAKLVVSVLASAQERKGKRLGDSVS